MSFPTYPEAFLGNNGFYTVATTQHPALYQQVGGDHDSHDHEYPGLRHEQRRAATGWELVTGDAETTDAGESITWSTSNPNTPLNLLPNTPSSPIGDACSNPVSPSGLTGVSITTYVGSQTVECASSTSDTSYGQDGHGHARIPSPDATHGDHGRDRP